MLDDRQDGARDILDLPLQVRGRRFYPEYAAPLAAVRVSGARRVEPPEGAYALLFAFEGCVRRAGSDAPEPAPIVGPIAGTCATSPDAEGWVVVFRPEVVNQSLAGWPSIAGDPAADPFLRRDAELLGAVLPSPGRAPAPLLLSVEESLYLRRVFSTMAGLLENQDDVYWPCRSRSCFLEILIFLWRRPSPEPIGEAPKLARRARDWILAHYAEPATLPGIARKLGSNRTSLQEQFKAEYGRTVMEYLGDIRAEAATILMRNTELSLAEIGDRVGYADYSNFYREFRRRKSASPRGYRESLPALRIYP